MRQHNSIKHYCTFNINTRADPVACDAPNVVHSAKLIDITKKQLLSNSSTYQQVPQMSVDFNTHNYLKQSKAM